MLVQPKLLKKKKQQQKPKPKKLEYLDRGKKKPTQNSLQKVQFKPKHFDGTTLGKGYICCLCWQIWGAGTSAADKQLRGNHMTVKLQTNAHSKQVVRANVAQKTFPVNIF